MKKRIEWIDMAKGYGILLVIYGHIDEFGTIGRWIYSFHVPLFFLLSGYVFNSDGGWKQFLKKKCRTILVPYFAYGIPILAVRFIKTYLQESLNASSVWKIMEMFLLQKRLTTLWFLTCLFCLSLLFYVLTKLIRSDALLICVSIVAAALGVRYYSTGGQPLVWNVDACLTALPFFCAGYLCKKKSAMTARFFEGRRIWAVMLGALFANLFFCGLNIRHSGATLDMYQSVYWWASLVYPAAFAGILFIVCLSKLRTVEGIAYIGRNSLIYFAWHQALILPVVGEVFRRLRLESVHPYEVAVVLAIVKTFLIVMILTAANMLITAAVRRIRG